jgi:hypothetical protein
LRPNFPHQSGIGSRLRGAPRCASGTPHPVRRGVVRWRDLEHVAISFQRREPSRMVSSFAPSLSPLTKMVPSSPEPARAFRNRSLLRSLDPKASRASYMAWSKMNFVPTGWIPGKQLRCLGHRSGARSSETVWLPLHGACFLFPRQAMRL